MPRKAKIKVKNEAVVEVEMTRAEKLQNLWPLLAILALTVLIYYNTLRNGFIFFDDPELVTDNFAIRQITWENFVHYFTTPVQFTYLPLGLLSYAIDYQIGKLDPFIYHLNSLIFHILTVLLVFWVFLRLTRKSGVAIFVTLLFAIHPVSVDNVAWVATRNNILATFFYLGALLFYSFYVKKNFQIRYLVLACIAFILSNLSKSSSVVLALTLFLWDYYYGRKWDKKLLIEKIPFFVIALFFGVMTLNIRTDVVPPVQYNLFDRGLIFCFSMTDYFVRLLFPFQLSMSYAYPVYDSNGLLPLQYYLSPVILGLIIWGLYLLKVTKKVLIVGLAFFFINIFLSQSVLLIDNFMANRYAYLSYLGLFLILADINERILNASASGWASKLKFVWLGVLVIFVTVFSFLTYNRNFVWKDTISLFDDVVQKQPNIAWVYSNRGIAKYSAGNYDDALKDFNQSLALNPNFTLSFYYRGVISYIRGDDQAALVDLDKTIANDPLFADGYLMRGKVKMALNDNPGAMDDLNKSIELDSYMVDAYVNRGILKNNLGDYQGAIADFDISISYSPENAAAFYMRSIAKFKLNDQAGSCADVSRALELGYAPTPEQVQQTCH